MTFSVTAKATAGRALIELVEVAKRYLIKNELCYCHPMTERYLASFRQKA